MKNGLLTIALICSSLIAVCQNITVYDNFDDYGKVNWIFLDSNMGGTFDPNFANPDQNGLNTSENVAKFTKPATVNATAFFFMEKPFDLSQKSDFSMLVFGQANTVIIMKLQHNDLNYRAGDTEVVKSYTIQKADTWEKAVFDFSESSSRTDLDKVVIEIQADVSEEKTFYFDELTGPEYLGTARLTYACTAFDGSELRLKCNKFMADPNSYSGFEIRVNETVREISTIAVVDTFAKFLVLKPEAPFEQDDNITVSYTENHVLSKSGWPLKHFDNIPVANATGKDTILVWSDEFAGEQLDTTTWTRLEGEFWFNDELQAYTKSEKNSYVEDGKLKITAIEEKYGSKDYTSARIVSRYHGDFRYGRLEASIKMPEGQGIWPAFWMMPTEDTYGSWPSSGEIDIMEFLGHDLKTNHGAVHYGDGQGSLHEQQHGAKYDSKKLRNEDFHTYAIEWEPGEFRWYFDDAHFHTAKASKTKYHWPFYHDFHFILNVAVGGRWPGNPDETTMFPQTLEVDYVRVYKYRKSDQNTGIFNDMPDSGQKEVKIFPNPVVAGRSFCVQKPAFKEAQIYLYSLQGKMVLRKSLGKDRQITIPDDIATGLYLIRIHSGNIFYTSKISIQDSMNLK